jgi:threonine dehydrogenase-like Zn-dependent dehydrogenase
MRDVPRYVKLIERGLYKTDKIVTKVFRLEQAREAVEAAAYREVVSAHVSYI